jgi:hypothetical protein
LLEKYSLTMEDITAKGIDLNEISEDEIEAKIIEVFEIEVEAQKVDAGEEIKEEAQPEGEQVEEVPVNEEEQPEVVVEEQPEDDVVEGEEPEVVEEQAEAVEETVDVEALQARIVELEAEITAKDVELNSLREFKLNVEKAEHEAKAQKLFKDFQLTAEDVEGLDVHAFSIEQIEEKCYAILGRKMASKKNFSKYKEEGNIRINIQSESNQEEQEKPYGDLFEKFNK